LCSGYIPNPQQLANPMGNKYQMLDLAALCFASLSIVVVLNLLFIAHSDLLLLFLRVLRVVLMQVSNICYKSKWISTYSRTMPIYIG
jgi:hypothetical protein